MSIDLYTSVNNKNQLYRFGVCRDCPMFRGKIEANQYAYFDTFSPQPNAQKHFLGIGENMKPSDFIRWHMNGSLRLLRMHECSTEQLIAVSKLDLSSVEQYLCFAGEWSHVRPCLVLGVGLSKDSLERVAKTYIKGNYDFGDSVTLVTEIEERYREVVCFVSDSASIAEYCAIKELPYDVKTRIVSASLDIYKPCFPSTDIYKNG